VARPTKDISVVQLAQDTELSSNEPSGVEGAGTASRTGEEPAEKEGKRNPPLSRTNKIDVRLA
jgi:hypothetical protein